MKKYLFAIGILFSGFTAFGQSAEEIASYMRDVYNWGVNDYYGTARTMGMGNAVTAVGGDIGTVAFNPAGSAVSEYMQVSLSPGVSIALSDSQGVPSSDGNTYMKYGAQSSAGRFVLPNGGFTIAFNTGNYSGLKRVSFGFVANTTNNFNDNIQGRGKSTSSSYAGYLACFANQHVTSYDASRNPVFDNAVAKMAYDADVIGIDSNFSNGFVGVTQNVCQDVKTGNMYLAMPGKLTQTFNRRTTGSKNDYIINLGFDISDIVYLGASLGIATQTYKSYDVIGESSDEPSLFQTGFKELSQTYSYQNSGVGVYGKFGIIVTPVAGLRLGAAFQTPTSMNMKESWGYTMSNKYQTDYRIVNVSASTDGGSWRCKLVQPLRFNMGLAYAFGERAIISADYEVVNYALTRMEAYYQGDEGYCNAISAAIAGQQGGGTEAEPNRCLGPSHMLRVGAEWKPWVMVPIRVGYNYTSGGEYQYIEGVRNSLRTDTHNVSVGAGYDSPRSFFCDVAFRYAWRPSERIQVYGDYDNQADPASTVYQKVGAPVLQAKRELMSVVATVGWRF